MRGSLRAAAAGFSAADAFSDIFGDVFGDIFGGGRRGGRQVFRGADLRYDLELDLEQAVFGHDAERRIHDARRMRDLQRQRRRAGLQARDLRDLPRRRPGAHAAGVLRGPADLPALQGPRPGDHPALRHLPRPGTHAQEEDSVGEGAGGRRQRRPHPPRRRRRSRAQRRAAGRPLRRDPRARARHLRARWQSPVVRGAGELRDRDARRAPSKCRRSAATST